MPAVSMHCDTCTLARCCSACAKRAHIVPLWMLLHKAHCSPCLLGHSIDALPPIWLYGFNKHVCASTLRSRCSNMI